jgi:cell pole-organizing protein PopZ
MEYAAEPAALPLTESDDAPLIGDSVRDAMQENLAALAMLAEPGARPQIVRSGETSLEGLTRELLRPMLAEWLEANLPAMVEKLVQAEIARIVGKRP